MQYICEESLENFDFLGGAVDTARNLTSEQFDAIEDYIDSFGETWTDTQINDFMWFETDSIAEILGYDSWEDFLNGDEDEDDDDDEDEDDEMEDED